MFLLRLALVGLVSLAAPAVAQTGAADTGAAETTVAPADVSVAALSKTMQLPALFEVLREEGVAYGETLETDMFPAGGGQAWDDAVNAIYDAPVLTERFETALEAEFADAPEALAEIIGFFQTELGQRIVTREIEARRDFLDEMTEESARVAADTRFAERDPLAELLRRFIEAGDMVEMNVAGSLSASLAFMTGLSEAGAYGSGLPQDQILSDVWAQETQIREDTTGWLYAYLGHAYGPLTQDEMRSYIEFAESPAGIKLNAALFAAFDEVFREVSLQLGRAAGLAMVGRDI